MIKIFILLFLMMFNIHVFAQSEVDEMRRQIDEMMKARDEMIKSLFDDSGDHNLGKHFEDLMKRFEKNNFGPDFDMGGDMIGEYDIRETETSKIFALKVKQFKDHPLDIKIEKGQIKIKGDVESINETSNGKEKLKTKRVSKIHFERIFPIPDGVDQTNPEFTNSDGELLIKFKKLKSSKIIPKNKKVLPVPVVPEDDKQRRPIDKGSNDITI